MRRGALVALVALAFPAAASAHATLRSTTPHFGTEVQRAPAAIRLRFDQHVKILPGAIQVLNGVGRNFARAPHVEGTSVVAGVAPLKLGTYTVRWRAVSADSHVV
jgi:methionine-rich copper-binding protein CopC